MSHGQHNGKHLLCLGIGSIFIATSVDKHDVNILRCHMWKHTLPTSWVQCTQCAALHFLTTHQFSCMHKTNALAHVFLEKKVTTMGKKSMALQATGATMDWSTDFWVPCFLFCELQSLSQWKVFKGKQCAVGSVRPFAMTPSSFMKQ